MALPDSARDNYGSTHCKVKGNISPKNANLNIVGVASGIAEVQLSEVLCPEAPMGQVTKADSLRSLQ